MLAKNTRHIACLKILHWLCDINPLELTDFVIFAQTAFLVSLCDCSIFKPSRNQLINTNITPTPDDKPHPPQS